MTSLAADARRPTTSRSESLGTMEVGRDASAPARQHELTHFSVHRRGLAR